jgi:signal transduction histidine kinase
MVHKELKDKCALCGKLITDTTKKTVIEEIIHNNHYKFDTRDCATMFKRLLGVYGNEFQHFLGDEQYISDPFWDRVVPKENEIKEIRANEVGKQKMVIDNSVDGTKSNKTINKPEIISLLKDSFQIQQLINHLIGSAKDDISLAIPTTATDIFFHPQGQASSFSCSVFFQQIKDVATANKKLDVKILSNAGGSKDEVEKNNEQREEEGETILSSLKQEEMPNIHVKYIEQDYSSLNENMVILVVDRKSSLAIELEENREMERTTSITETTSTTETNSHKIIKLATYSNNKSTVLSYVSIFESLWKEIELNERITELLEEIRRRENIEKDFIFMAAHELRTPIQPVLGLAQILQSKKNFDTKEQEELLSVIIRNARRLNILTENLLDLTKIENKALKLEKENFNLSDLVFEAISDAKSQLSSTQITINVENDNSSIIDMQCGDTTDITNSKGTNNSAGQNAFLVEADKTRIMQVIYNLLTNAIKFTKRGTIRISLKIKKIDDKREREKGKLKGEGMGEMAKEEIIVSFKDSGTGIDSEIISRLFEKFVTKSDRGTGLGLFISRNIIEAHGGDMWAENNPEGKGATFTFSLPRKQSIDY